MTRFVDGPEVEVSAVIHAPPDVVWRLVTDINIAASFQSEFLEAEWLDDGPALEARFVGRNQRGTRTWETTSWIVTYRPIEAFGWAVSDRHNPGATWTYFLEDLGESTRLRYHRTVGPGPSGLTAAIDKYPDREEEFIAARDEEHQLHMQAVVDGIKALAEENG